MCGAKRTSHKRGVLFLLVYSKNRDKDGRNKIHIYWIEKNHHVSWKIDSVILSNGKTATAGYTEPAVDITNSYYAGGSLYFLY